MKSFKNTSLAILAIIALGFASCKEDTTQPTPTPTDPYKDLVLIGEAPAVGTGTIVKLYAEEELFMGYNRLHVVVLDSANPKTFIKDAHISFMPLMDMGTMTHSCPVEDPINAVEEGTNAFLGAVVFIMPTTVDGSWVLDIGVHNHMNDKEGEASFPITVLADTEPRLFSFVSAYDSAKVFVALKDPMKPAIGINNFNLAIYQKETMMSFPGYNGIVVKSEPWMPSMNHGSPNNVDPVSVGNGIYEGQVNFTMTGYWQIKLNFETANGDVIASDKFFDITF